MRIKYLVQFQQRKTKLSTSPLYLTDETYLVEIMELVSGMFLSKRVVTHTGTESTLTEIGRAFEYLFNIKLGDVHKKHEVDGTTVEEALRNRARPKITYQYRHGIRPQRQVIE